jgi:hypothetical protein
MSDEDLKARVRKRYPHIIPIEEALTNYYAGTPIIAKCPVCGGLLQVFDNPDIGSRLVVCPKKCTFVHTNYEPLRNADLTE